LVVTVVIVTVTILQKCELNIFCRSVKYLELPIFFYPDPIPVSNAESAAESDPEAEAQR
jgi:hypothetical protein